jgi:hypothetical protein
MCFNSSIRKASLHLRILHMIILSFLTLLRPNRRSVLRDMYAFGIVNIFRRPSIFRIWEPLRETPRTSDELMG